MANRKKRLKKGIKSLQEQINVHEEKKRLSEESDNKELVRYYEKEIKAKEKAKKEKEAILEKQ